MSNDPAFIILFFFVVVGIPVLAATARKMWKEHLGFKERTLAASEGLKDAEKKELLGRVERLEERVRVLERISTDRAGHLAEEIESLRKS